jgi:lysophospholipase L1-like esterase
VLGRNPRVLCLEIGSNDLQTKVPTERVIENIRAITATASQAGSLVILQSVPFVVVGYRPGINDSVKRLNARLRDLANEAQVRSFDLNAILADGEALDPRNSFDGLHLNARGYLLWTADTRSGVARRAAVPLEHFRVKRSRGPHDSLETSCSASLAC